jgi:hypothetical protein
MSMIHSAFAFDYDKFEKELLSILLEALSTQDTVALVSWIDGNHTHLVDPYEGNPLEEDWKSAWLNSGVQVLGDLALTKFYDPTFSVGLDEDWEDMEAALEKAKLSTSIILGTPIGSDETVPFDPGGCGSYFQSREEVLANSVAVASAQARSQAMKAKLEPVSVMLNAAVKAGRGLYATF